MPIATIRLDESVAIVEGGLQIAVDGRIIGSIGVSEVTAQQDAQIARAGVDALK